MVFVWWMLDNTQRNSIIKAHRFQLVRLDVRWYNVDCDARVVNPILPVLIEVFNAYIKPSSPLMSQMYCSPNNIQCCSIHWNIMLFDTSYITKYAIQTTEDNGKLVEPIMVWIYYIPITHQMTLFMLNVQCRHLQWQNNWQGCWKWEFFLEMNWLPRHCENCMLRYQTCAPADLQCILPPVIFTHPYGGNKPALLYTIKAEWISALVALYSTHAIR